MTPREVAGWAAAFVLAVGLLLGLTFVIQGHDFFLYKLFAPQYEAVRRDTFEQSKAYNQGMVQELQAMRYDYVKASPEHKAALRDLILHRAADYPPDRMPADLRGFISELKEGTR